jgi:hypothetical protein
MSFSAARPRPPLVEPIVPVDVLVNVRGIANDWTELGRLLELVEDATAALESAHVTRLRPIVRRRHSELGLRLAALIEKYQPVSRRRVPCKGQRRRICWRRAS